MLNDDVANLAKVVTAAEKTLFCLDEDCVSLTRIWCLYELCVCRCVWQTFLCKGVDGLVVLMPTSLDAARLRTLFETFDVISAQATQPEDREKILTEISDSIGSTQLILNLKEALVGSAKAEANRSTSELKGVAGHLQALRKATLLSRVNGNLDEAEDFYRLAVTAAREEYTSFDSITADLNHQLGICLNEQGRHSEAEELFLGAIQDQELLLGKDHPCTLGTLNSLAI